MRSGYHWLLLIGMAVHARPVQHLRQSWVPKQTTACRNTPKPSLTKKLSMSLASGPLFSPQAINMRPIKQR
ncbi:hypothetical protein V8C44DRAFT_314321 [Trichoderma aethiopicum]